MVKSLMWIQYLDIATSQHEKATSLNKFPSITYSFSGEDICWIGGFHIGKANTLKTPNTHVHDHDGTK